MSKQAQCNKPYLHHTVLFSKTLALIPSSMKFTTTFSFALAIGTTLGDPRCSPRTGTYLNFKTADLIALRDVYAAKDPSDKFRLNSGALASNFRDSLGTAYITVSNKEWLLHRDTHVIKKDLGYTLSEMHKHCCEGSEEWLVILPFLKCISI